MRIFLEKIIWAFLFLPVLLSAAVVAENGKSDYDIVIRKDAPRVTVYAAKELADKVGVEMPIVNAVYDVLYNGLDPKTAVDNLMTRSLKEE